MSQWGKSDQANNAPIWAAAQSKQKANTGNRDALYGNGTATGLFAVDAAEITAGGGTIAHTGWIRRVVGTGRRSGRVQTEVLIAGGIDTDGEDDDIFSDTTITISVQPASKSVNTGLATTFSVGAVANPVVTMTYQWQANTGSGLVNLIDGNIGPGNNSGTYSNVTTSTLSISDVSSLDGVTFAVVVSASGANSVTSANATLTVV